MNTTSVAFEALIVAMYMYIYIVYGDARVP